MKKLFTFLTLFMLCCGIKVNAQYCGAPFNGSICPPDTQTEAGFAPNENQLPCIQPGVPYSQVIQVFVPDTFTYTGLGTPLLLDIDSVHIDSISNLPCGMCWSFSNSSNMVYGGKAGCLLLQGTTSDNPGEYLLHVIVDAYLNIGNLKDQNLSTLGLSYYVRVSFPGDSCAPVDTGSAGNTTSAKGSIATPSISGGSSVCSGSTETLSVSGGSYAGYLWSTGATTSSITAGAGTYAVTVYGNCNSATATKIVGSTSVTTPTITPAGPLTICAGSDTGLTASAGSAWKWSTGATTQNITVNAGGTYTVVVTNASGCTATSAGTVVTANAAPNSSINESTSGSSCAGAAVTLSVDSIGAESFKWSTGSTLSNTTVTASGSYSVTVSSGSCSSSSSISVTVSAGLNITLTDVNPRCYGEAQGSITSSVTGGSGLYAYNWSNSATSPNLTNVVAGGYSVTVTDDSTGCSATKSTTLSNPASHLLLDVTAKDPKCPKDNGSVKVKEVKGTGTKPYTYHWSNGSTKSSATKLGPGTYSYTVTEEGGCEVSGSATISCPVAGDVSEDNSLASDERTAGIAAPPTVATDATFDVKVLPNPFSSIFHLQVTSSSTDNMDVKVYDLLGRVMEHQENVAYGTDVTFGNSLAVGVYLVTVKQGDQITTIRVVKAE